MTNAIRAPWTPEQVDALNRFQQEGGMHPFTCGGDHTPGSPMLVAHEDGWHCPDPYREGCDYQQDWAHAFMADPNAWPKPFQSLRETERRERAEAALRELLACLYPITRLGDPTPLGWQTGNPIPAPVVARWRGVLEAAAPAEPTPADEGRADRAYWTTRFDA